MPIAVGYMKKIELWTLLKDIDGFLSVESVGDPAGDNTAITYAVIPVPRGASDELAREIARIVADSLNAWEASRGV